DAERPRGHRERAKRVEGRGPHETVNLPPDASSATRRRSSGDHPLYRLSSTFSGNDRCSSPSRGKASGANYSGTSWRMPMSAYVTRASRAACAALITVARALTGDTARAQQDAAAPHSRVTTIA